VVERDARRLRVSEPLQGLIANGVDIRGPEMKDTAHDMPPRFDIDVERWMKRRLGQ
jgi:hypothetical protein